MSPQTQLCVLSASEDYTDIKFQGGKDQEEKPSGPKFSYSFFTESVVLSSVQIDLWFKFCSQITHWSNLRPKFMPISSGFLGVPSIFFSMSRRVLAAEGWGVLGGLTGCSPEGVSERTWKCEVGGGPMGVGLLSESTCKQVMSFRKYVDWVKHCITSYIVVELACMISILYSTVF